MEQPQKPPGFLEAYTKRATLYRVPSSEPGVVTSWWICHSDAHSDLVLSLISISQLREDFGRGAEYRRDADPFSLRRGPSFKQQLSDYLESSGGLDTRQISHIVVVAWRSRIPSRLKGERRAYLARPLAVIPADLVGMTFAWAAGDNYAIVIVRAMAKRTLYLAPARYQAWVDLVDATDWLALLESYALKAFKGNHVLQPRRQPR
ncbi:hypothetical protein ACQ4M4_12885 [Leptolyngbya sp. AN02str]|uniref:hypothetical protein n=1 Tax=Leptolyngbya sp. AN02str TaxID=3423363 RepID=UPI003D315565